MAQIKDRMTDDAGRTSHEIRTDIRRTRERMDVTVDAIEDKLTPGELVHEAWTLVRGGSSSSLTRVWKIAKDYPIPAAIISVGLGWMMYESSGRGDGQTVRAERHRARYSDAGYGAPEAEEPSTLESARQGAAAAARRATDAAGSAIDKVGDLAGQARDMASDAAGSMRGQAAELGRQASDFGRQASSELGRQASALGDQTRQGLRQARTGLWKALEEQPLLVGAAALAAGLLVGLLLPSTRREGELMGDARDSLIEGVKGFGLETLEKGKQVAAAAAETLMQGAEAQGLSAETVAEKVRAVGREVVETVKSEAQKQNLTGETLSDEAQKDVQRAPEPPKHRAA